MNTLEQLRAGALAGSQRLKLACGLTEFPREIFALADTLEVLDLSDNALSTLPQDLPRLHRLRILFGSQNQFTELPQVLGDCPQLSMVGFKSNRIRTVSARSLPARLRWLILTDNEIEVLPAELGRRPELQKLALAGNRLQALPPEMAACARLELLRLSANRLTELPAWLLALPRLSWLAYAGNPFCAQREAETLTQTPIPAIPWPALRPGPILGQGASGVIYRADHLAGAQPSPVALKLFKGAVTSDGFPASEMAACLRAGGHPNLIPLLGRLEAHPNGVQGLVMALIDPAFRALAGPPSLQSCTRDVYPEGTRFDPLTLLSIAHGIASAACHLHRRGILHGDLYAHNILHHDHGHALLGDFGAASFYAADSSPLALALERVEVRAFGCLLEELIERCEPAPSSPSLHATLAQLRDDCLDDQPAKRPLFGPIQQALAGLLDAARAAATGAPDSTTAQGQLQPA